MIEQGPLASEVLVHIPQNQRQEHNRPQGDEHLQPCFQPFQRRAVMIPEYHQSSCPDTLADKHNGERFPPRDAREAGGNEGRDGETGRYLGEEDDFRGMGVHVPLQLLDV